MVVATSAISSGRLRAGDVLRWVIAAARARRRRRVLGAVAAGIAAVSVAGVMLTWPGGNSTSTSAGHTRLVMAQPPFAGVACHTANVTTCGRIGIAVWFPRPPGVVTATLATESVTLHRSGRDGKVLTYWGYVHLSRPQLHLPVVWEGTPARHFALRITARVNGALVQKTLRVQLNPGWG